MEVNTSSVTERGIFSWVFLGPISMLLSLSLLLVTTPQDFPLTSVIALTGMGITWNYRLKGLIASFCLLSLAAFYEVVIDDTTHLMWFIGSIFTISCSYLITFLTLEEATDVVSSWRSIAVFGIQEKEEAINQAVGRLEEKERTFIQEKEALKTEIATLEAKALKALSEQSSLEKVNELSRLELLSTISKQDQLNEELFSLRNKHAKLEEQLEEFQALTQSHKDALEKWTREKNKGEEKSLLIDQLTREKDLFESTLSRIQEELELKEQAMHELEEKLKQELKKPPAQPPAPLEPLSETLPTTEGEIRRLYGMHKQLRDQFQIKSQELDEARKELFHAQEEVAVLKIELTELELNSSPEFKLLTIELENALAKYEEALHEITTLVHHPI